MSLWLPDTGEQIDHDALQGLSDDDHSLYALLSGETGQFILSPSAAHDPVMQIKLDNVTDGKVIQVNATSAVSISDTFYGMILDFNTNVTHNDKAIEAILVRVPGSTHQSCNAFEAQTWQEAGDVINIQHQGATMAGNDELRGLLIAMGNLTINNAGAEFFGIDVDMEDSTYTDLDKMACLRLRGPIQGSMTGNIAAVARFQAGHDNPSTEVAVEILNSDGRVVDANMSIYPSGYIFNIEYDTAETLDGTLVGYYSDLATNVTPNGNITESFVSNLTFNDVNNSLIKMRSGGGAQFQSMRINGPHEVDTAVVGPTAMITLPIAADRVYHVRATVLAGEPATQNVASYTYEATVRDNGAGIAVIVNQTPVHTGEDVGAWDSIFFVNGADNNLYVNVTGQAGVNIHWSGWLEITEMVYNP